MDPLILARWQYAITTVYHFFFVPLTLGLSILVAIMETLYVKTGDETYKKMTKFWGKLFLINFAMGVVTGIVQEFQFGMNWSEYSRFVGDIFGAPLAIEALLAFFLESTFLGVWIFGWNRLSKKAHAGVMWLVAIGSNLSALWILIANSWMHEPVGYVIQNGRAEMTDFFALLTNPHVWVQFPHVLTAGISTAAFFMLGITAYHLLKKSPEAQVWQKSLTMACVAALIGSLSVAFIGHAQGMHMVKQQPMKMAAAEALWESENPAGFSVIAGVNEKERTNDFQLKIPGILSFLAYGSFEGEVKGINNLQEEFEAKYGPGDYIPPVTLSFWLFRIMVGVGSLMILIAIALAVQVFRKKTDFKPVVLTSLIWFISLPYIANTTGWLFTELGRQPWAVYGLLLTKDSVSPTVGPGAVLFTLIGYTVVYAALMVVDVYLLRKFAIAGITDLDKH